MTDTVTLLMAKVHAIENLAALAADPMNSDADQTEYVHDLVEARQALEAELTRLFTPLSDEQIATVYFGATGQSLRPQDNVLAHKFAKAIEQQHGIRGES